MQHFLSLIFERMSGYFNVPSFEGEHTHTHTHTHTHHTHTHTHTHTPEAMLTLVTLSKTRSLWPSEEED